MDSQCAEKSLRVKRLVLRRVPDQLIGNANSYADSNVLNFQKPDSLVLVEPENVEVFLASLPVRRLLWLGRKTEAKLKPLGIITMGDLSRCDPSVLAEMFGITGAQICLMSRGIDNGSWTTSRDQIYEP